MGIIARARGMTVISREAGVTRESLPGLAEQANQQWTARFNPRPVTMANILSLYEAAW